MYRSLPISEHLYAALLNLYPAKFRAAYERQMRLTFHAACMIAYRRGGSAGLLALWLPTLFDLFKSALEERARQGEIIMSKERLSGLAGPLTIAVGLLWLTASVGELVLLLDLVSMDPFWDTFSIFPLALSFLPMLPALIGSRLRYKDDAGGLGRFGLIMGVGGCAGMYAIVLASIVIGNIPPYAGNATLLNIAVSACFLSIMVGYILFGIDALRNRLLPRWNVMPLLVGLPSLLTTIAFGIIMSTFPIDNQSVPVLITTFSRLVITGLAWVLLGVAMMDQRSIKEAAAAA